MEQRIDAVGIVGLGKMGLPMGRHLVRAGFKVYGYDPRPEALNAAEAIGITPAASNAAVARESEFVIVIVGFDKQVDEILFGRNGLIEGARPGLLVGVASTIAPSYMRKLPQRVGSREVRFLDLPIARGEMAAEKGDLLVFVGGDKADFDRCRPAIDSFSEFAAYLGGLGAGQVAKAANNMLLWACLTASVEALDWGEALGVEREALRQALLHSSGENWAMRTRADERPALWAEKDMMIVLSEADTARIAMPVMGTVKEAIKGFKVARNLPMPNLDD